jgi:hypothetical protein
MNKVKVNKYKILDTESYNFLNASINIKLFEQLGYEFYLNDFKKDIPKKAKRSLTELLTFLIAIPTDKEKLFLDYILRKGDFVKGIFGVLFANMRGIRLSDAKKIYDYLINYQITQKPRFILENIFATYNIKVVFKKELFRKNNIFLYFPLNFYDKIAEEKKLYSPRKEKKQIISISNWNKFVDWCSNCNYYSLNNNLHLNAYILFYYHAEVMNGGHFQFFNNKSYWDFNYVSNIFKLILSKKLYNNFYNALDIYKKNKNEFNHEYDYTKYDEKYYNKNVYIKTTFL